MSSSFPPFGRYAVFIVLALALILPYAIVAHTYPVPTFYAEFVALALYLLLGATVVLATREVASPAVALVPLAFGLLLVAQTFVLPVSQPSMNWLGAGCLLAAAVAAHTGYALARARLLDKTMCWAAYALLAGGLFAVSCQVVQLLHLEAYVNQFVKLPFLEARAGPFRLQPHLEAHLDFVPFVIDYSTKELRRPFGNMAQANHLATYISFAMASALFLVQTRRLNVFVWALLSVVYALGLALTVSRGPWLQMAVIVVAGFWMAAARRGGARSNGLKNAPENTSGSAPANALAGTPGSALENTPKSPAPPGIPPGVTPKAPRSAIFAWSIPVALVVLFFAVNMDVRWANLRYHLNLAESAAERFHDAGQISPRLALWHYGLAMFRAHPLLGVGWGEFPRWQLALARELGGVEIANNSHDVFIDLLAKTGLVGCAIVVLGLGAWFVRALRTPRSAAQIFGFALIGVLTMHALVEYPQQYLFFLLPAMFVFGLLETRALRFVPPGASTVAYAGVVLAGLAALYPVFRDYTRAEALYYGNAPEKQYRAAPSYLFGAWDDYGLATLQPMNATNLPAKLAAHERAIALLPGETVLRRYAVLQALDGNTAGALDTVARLKIFATGPTVPGEPAQQKDWPMQLDDLYALCDEQKTALAAFKARLVSRYGPATVTGESEAGDPCDDSSGSQCEDDGKDEDAN